MKRRILSVLTALFTAASSVASSSIPEAPPSETLRMIPAVGFARATGRSGARGAEADYRRDKPGFLMMKPSDPLRLEPGFYRATFTLRRGNYPAEGLFRPTFPVFQVSVIDATSGQTLAERELQVSDFSKGGHYEPRWIEFSVGGKSERTLEPRVFWPGLVNGEVESVRIERLPVDTAEHLNEKARAMADRIRRNHLENGFVVSRKPDGQADEVGDALTYTGFYAAALSWKLALTNDAFTTADLESAMHSLLNAVKGTYDEPVITRFIDAEENPAPKSPSRDVYTSFFFACAAAYPRIHDQALRAEIRSAVNRVATRLLKDDLSVKSGATTLTTLAPHFDPSDIQQGLHTLATDRKRAKKVLKTLRDAKRIVPFQELWPGMKEVMTAIEQRDETTLYNLVVPTMNGAVVMIERLRDLLKESGRTDLVRLGKLAPERPGKRLAMLLTQALKKLPPEKNGKRFERITDLRVMASNSVIALHIIKTAAVITGSSQFEEYYRQNLYTQDALLKTALDWYGMEDDFIRLTAGNAEADRGRSGYLPLLAAYNLFLLEKNPDIRKSYRTIIAKEAELMRLDDNPLSVAAAVAANVPTSEMTVWRALTLYPEDPVGFGKSFWAQNGEEIARDFGGGQDERFSREPLPVSHRPRDSFLWQRNPRRLRGDHPNNYPGADYFFLYWMARKHNIVPTPNDELLVDRR